MSASQDRDLDAVKKLDAAIEVAQLEADAKWAALNEGKGRVEAALDALRAAQAQVLESLKSAQAEELNRKRAELEEPFEPLAQEAKAADDRLKDLKVQRRQRVKPSRLDLALERLPAGTRFTLHEFPSPLDQSETLAIVQSPDYPEIGVLIYADRAMGGRYSMHFHGDPECARFPLVCMCCVDLNCNLDMTSKEKYDVMASFLQAACVKANIQALFMRKAHLLQRADDSFLAGICFSEGNPYVFGNELCKRYGDKLPECILHHMHEREE